MLKRRFRFTVLLLCILAMVLLQIPAAASDGRILILPVTHSFQGKSEKAEKVTLRLEAGNDQTPMPDGKTGGSAELLIGADQSLAFPGICYTAPGIYHYTLSEIAGCRKNVTYDSRIYQICVTVTNDHTPITAFTLKGKEGKYTKLSFEDSCKAEPQTSVQKIIPQTGDRSMGRSWALLTGSTALLGLVIFWRRRHSGI